MSPDQAVADPRHHVGAAEVPALPPVLIDGEPGGQTADLSPESAFEPASGLQELP
jgi:hypothetical protein